jgi:putative restriction endonuclease
MDSQTPLISRHIAGRTDARLTALFILRQKLRPMVADNRDRDVRLRVFNFLAAKTAQYGEVLPWAVLSQGIIVDEQRVPLIGPQGIFKPAVLSEMPISITTAPIREGQPRPYDDGIDAEGLLEYKYRGADPFHRDNVGLRLAMARRVPLVYLFGVVKGQYMPVWPVFIVGDDPTSLVFKVAVDDRRLDLLRPNQLTDQVADARRGYLARVTMTRLHQAAFRERVLRAYEDSCAICQLRHRELLEAAHILPDGHPEGAPVIPNGVSLCKLHHAAFDRCILGIRPDCVVEVRSDILAEVDGPMLRHGLQGIAGTKLVLPRNAQHHPRKEFLEERYEIFLRAS